MPFRTDDPSMRLDEIYPTQPEPKTEPAATKPTPAPAPAPAKKDDEMTAFEKRERARAQMDFDTWKAERDASPMDKARQGMIDRMTGKGPASNGGENARDAMIQRMRGEK